MKAEQRKADRAALVDRLAELRERGGRVPCLEVPPALRGMWTSEDVRDQERAARLCGGCAAATTCGQYGMAHRKEFGVYGGATNSERQPKRGRPAKNGDVA